ncbi:hypothetical protein K474DRAFT_1051927 [Panus rudis PR-1116 ss-1]|nr:hypothetical protein K474DRAFT_1051927 [Panus rudis PR-1116 ss-1]
MSKSTSPITVTTQASEAAPPGSSTLPRVSVVRGPSVTQVGPPLPPHPPRSAVHAIPIDPVLLASEHGPTSTPIDDPHSTSGHPPLIEPIPKLAPCARSATASQIEGSLSNVDACGPSGPQHLDNEQSYARSSSAPDYPLSPLTIPDLSETMDDIDHDGTGAEEPIEGIGFSLTAATVPPSSLPMAPHDVSRNAQPEPLTAPQTETSQVRKPVSKGSMPKAPVSSRSLRPRPPGYVYFNLGHSG